jgi:hypothetical protein
MPWTGKVGNGGVVVAATAFEVGSVLARPAEVVSSAEVDVPTDVVGSEKVVSTVEYAPPEELVVIVFARVGIIERSVSVAEFTPPVAFVGFGVELVLIDCVGLVGWSASVEVVGVVEVAGCDSRSLVEEVLLRQTERNQSRSLRSDGDGFDSGPRLAAGSGCPRLDIALRSQGNQRCVE